MSTTTERFLVRGEWDDEPDREEFDHAELPCLILRAHSGALCGYVGVPPAHPLYEPQIKKVDWGTGEYDNTHNALWDYARRQEIELGVDVNFSRMGTGEVWPEGFHWFGFDCNHIYDYAPPRTKEQAEIHGLYQSPHEHYHNWASVKADVGHLAGIVAAMMPQPSYEEWRKAQEPAHD